VDMGHLIRGKKSDVNNNASEVGCKRDLDINGVLGA
jgi:hypothetical protein